jgi:hypothetical protein
MRRTAELLAIFDRARAGLRGSRSVKRDGVILFSGGMDCVCLGILARRRGLNLTPVYASHRANVGNVTKKELSAAVPLARPVTGNELVTFKPPAKKQPPWYGDDVRYTPRLPVASERKSWRNRIMLDVLHDADLTGGLVVVGVFGGGERAAQAGRGEDVSKTGLAAHMKKIGARGQVLTAEDFFKGEVDKVKLLNAVSPGSKEARLVRATESCLMYFASPCGNCWSCVDRARAFMQSWGSDTTPYRPKTTAWSIARGIKQ